MASEIQFTYSLMVNNPQNGIGVAINKTFPQKTINQATQGISHNILSVTTANLALSMGNVATPGVTWITNLDATNFVDIGIREAAGNFAAFMRIFPGESWPFRANPSVALYGAANTANVKIEYTINAN